MDDFVLKIAENVKVSADAYKMTLKSAVRLPEIVGGQFLQFYIPDRQDLSLRRPFCVCEYDAKSVTIYYAVMGGGTAAMAALKKGAVTRCVLPLGNGFVLKKEYKNVALIGGGLGVAPLLPVIKSYPDKNYRAYLGFKSAAHIILHKEFEAVCGCEIVTDDGSYGARGFPTDALKREIESGYKPDVLLTCGPEPLMKAVKNIATAYNIDAFMTGENRMGCGVGACLVCTCAVKGGDGAYHNLRACVEGPVFDIRRVKM